MNVVLIVLGVILLAFGILFSYRFLTLKKSYQKTQGRVLDSKKVAPNGRIPGGYQTIAEYQVGKKRTRGYSMIPAKAKYANGLKINLYYHKKKPDNFLIAAYFSAMKIYCLALPTGLLCLIGGILLSIL
jgi:hypothetical protein